MTYNKVLYKFICLL